MVSIIQQILITQPSKAGQSRAHLEVISLANYLIHYNGLKKYMLESSLASGAIDFKEPIT